MTYRRYLVIGGILAVAGLVIAGCSVLVGSFSPRGYVESTYSRAITHDIDDDAVAFTSTHPPSRVAKEISDSWQPADHFVDGSGVYLRYDSDSVVILPQAVGSLILLEKVSTAYPRYHAVVGKGWGWGRGATIRNGGPGDSK